MPVSHSAPWSIRPATQADAAAAAAVVHAVFDEYGFTWEAEGYHQDLYHLGTYYLARGHRFWVAEQAGRVVGTVALERFPCPIPGLDGEILLQGGLLRIGGCDCSLDRLYVHPDARKQGIGLSLVQTVLSEARALRLTRLEIWSDKRYQEAHRLYQQAGARIVGERICNDPDLSPEWGLQLILESSSSS